MHISNILKVLNIACPSRFGLCLQNLSTLSFSFTGPNGRAQHARVTVRRSQKKYEIERLAHELQEVKEKYLAQKRKDHEYR